MDSRGRMALRRYLCVLLLLIASVPAWTQDTAPPPQAVGDNSKVNQQDRSTAEPTADQQKNNKTDLEITRDIRRSLMNDKSLSTYAHNVKIVTQHGKVTLKGPVRSDNEKDAVEAKAVQVAGKTNVTDQMTVVPKND
jgi:hyperosmotically inducible protein